LELTDLSNPDDVHGLRKRDPRVYEIIFKKYYPKLLVFVNRHVGDQDVAQDIVQDIFFKLFESSRSLPDNFNLKSWLYKVARNAALDYLRHLQVIDRHKFLMADAMIVAEDVDENVDEEETGTISIAENGSLTRFYNKDTLRKLLTAKLIPEKPEAKKMKGKALKKHKKNAPDAKKEQGADK